MSTCHLPTFSGLKICCGLLQLLAPHTAPIWVSAVRLLPAGLVLIGWAARQGRPQPKGPMAWAAISLFALADGTCFQVSIPKHPFRLQATPISCLACPWRLPCLAAAASTPGLCVACKAANQSQGEEVAGWCMPRFEHACRASWQRGCRGPLQGLAA